MSPDLVLAKQFIYDPLNFAFLNFEEETESNEYSACTFLLNNKKIKFRSAKITPTKTGAFVTLWKRDRAGITCPHDDTDPFEFYVIGVRNKKVWGQFVFPKAVLLKNSILSTQGKEGKRGFRVYPDWDKVENKQAEKTQKWQSEFFLDLSTENAFDVERARFLYTQI